MVRPAAIFQHMCSRRPGAHHHFHRRVQRTRCLTTSIEELLLAAIAYIFACKCGSFFLIDR